MADEIFKEFPQIITERLRLREMTQEDSESIYKLLCNPDVIGYDTFEQYTSIKQAQDFIDWMRKQFQDKRSIFWGISLIGHPEIIGFCKCEIEVPEIRADLGYDLSPEYWNKGIMTEALNAIIGFAFNVLSVNRIEAAVSTENPASIRVLEKVGFIREGILRERSCMHGRCHDMMFLSMLMSDYRTR